MGTRTILAAAAALLIAATPAKGQLESTSQPPAASIAFVGAAQPQVEIMGIVGYTSVNTEKWSGTSNNDWGTLNYGLAGRVFIPVAPGVRAGLEAGYNYHFWYNYFPGGTSYVYEYHVNSAHVAGFVRLPVMPKFALDVGGGVHFFNNAGTHPGAFGALTYQLGLGPVTVPVGVRADVIFTNPMVMPIVATAGVGFKL